MKQDDLLKIAVVAIIAAIIIFLLIRQGRSQHDNKPTPVVVAPQVDPIVGTFNYEQTTQFPPEMMMTDITTQGVMQFKEDGTVTHIPSVFLGARIPGAPSVVFGSNFLGKWRKTGQNKYHVETTAICVFYPPQDVGPNNFSRARMVYDIVLTPGGVGTTSFVSTTVVQTEHSLGSIPFDTPFFSLNHSIEALRVI